MQRSSFDKWLVTLALAAVMAGAIFHFIRSDREAPAQNQMRNDAGPSGTFKAYDFRPAYLPSVPRPAKTQPEPGAGPENFPREKIEAWLTKHHRDAKSLLAAFRESGDTNYLNEAAENFPNHPQVDLAVLARDEFPADRRKWLDLFKTSSPSNSLANYLSAEDYFKNGNTDAAVQELLAATGKTQFENFAVESELDLEQLARFSGESPIEAYQTALGDYYSQGGASELATLKRLAFGIQSLQAQEAAAGDKTSVQNLAQMGMVLGNQLASGGGGKLIIHQLVGIADEAIVLSQLDQNSSYDFLGGRTPGQVLQQNQAWKASVRELNANFPAAYAQLTDAEKLSYIKRSQTQGELAAMRWVVQRHPQPHP